MSTKGFGTLELIITIILVILAGGGGFFAGSYYKTPLTSLLNQPIVGQKTTSTNTYTTPPSYIENQYGSFIAQITKNDEKTLTFKTNKGVEGTLPKSPQLTINFPNSKSIQASFIYASTSASLNPYLNKDVQFGVKLVNNQFVITAITPITISK